MVRVRARACSFTSGSFDNSPDDRASMPVLHSLTLLIGVGLLGRGMPCQTPHLSALARHGAATALPARARSQARRQARQVWLDSYHQGRNGAPAHTGAAPEAPLGLP